MLYVSSCLCALCAMCLILLLSSHPTLSLFHQAAYTGILDEIMNSQSQTHGLEDREKERASKEKDGEHADRYEKKQRWTKRGEGGLIACGVTRRLVHFLQYPHQSEGLSEERPVKAKLYIGHLECVWLWRTRA